MDNPEIGVTLGTHVIERRQTKQKTQHKYRRWKNQRGNQEWKIQRQWQHWTYTTQNEVKQNKNTKGKTNLQGMICHYIFLS